MPKLFPIVDFEAQLCSVKLLEFVECLSNFRQLHNTLDYVWDGEILRLGVAACRNASDKIFGLASVAVPLLPC